MPKHKIDCFQGHNLISWNSLLFSRVINLKMCGFLLITSFLDRLLVELISLEVVLNQKSWYKL